jgi:Spy/CpxP family protein refolding chaperone
MTQSDSPRSEGLTDNPQPGRRRWRWALAGIAALAAVVTGAVATKAFEHGPFWRPGAFMMGPFNAAAVEDRVDRMIRHLAIEVDANADQQEKLRAIAKAAVKDLVPLREKAQAARERGHVLLTQPAIDRAAIEALRAEQMALADQASRRFAQALGDAAEVLTVEQRRKIDDRLTGWHNRWHGWHRG